MRESFTINELYSHEEVYRSLGVGNAGGVRFVMNSDGTTKRAVLFTSVPVGRIQSENPYHDRIENDILVYTAQGRKGEQGFGGQNQRLLTHGTELYPIYCFQLICSRRNKDVGIKRWRFMGFPFGLRRYKERQYDILGESRNACIFEFAIISDFRQKPMVSVSHEWSRCGWQLRRREDTRRVRERRRADRRRRGLLELPRRSLPRGDRSQ